MRNYKGKMERYRLPASRYRELKAYCVQHRRSPKITEALRRTTDDALAAYIRKQVTESCSLAALEAAGLPCNRDTFRVYRAKFFWTLDMFVPNGAARQQVFCDTKYLKE